MELPAYQDRRFQILFRKKIPYWSELLLGVTFVLIVVLFLFYLVMLPSTYASGEMKVAYYILGVPDWLKTISSYSVLGLLLILPVYYVSKSYKPGLVLFTRDSLTITGGITKEISLQSIRKIILNDVRYLIRRTRKAAEVVIIQTGGRKTSFLLKDYDESQGFVEAVSGLENVDFFFYNETGMEVHDHD